MMMIIIIIIIMLIMKLRRRKKRKKERKKERKINSGRNRKRNKESELLLNFILKRVIFLNGGKTRSTNGARRDMLSFGVYLYRVAPGMFSAYRHHHLAPRSDRSPRRWSPSLNHFRVLVVVDTAKVDLQDTYPHSHRFSAILFKPVFSRSYFPCAFCAYTLCVVTHYDVTIPCNARTDIRYRARSDSIMPRCTRTIEI